jgi:dipeptidyl-peptidase-3
MGSDFFVEQFADLKIMRYQVPGFEKLSLKQKELIYYLSEAAICGRDIIFDQNYKHNLLVRKTLEHIYKNYSGDRKCDDFQKFVVYLKRVWFSNGIHHHYSMDKFFPEISEDYFAELLSNSQPDNLSLIDNETKEHFIERISDIIFSQEIAPKRVSLDSSKDLILNSACNYYEGVSQKEAESFYENIKDENNPRPVSYGLNSRLVKVDGEIKEEVCKIGGRYSEAIENIVRWLENASQVAENDNQKAVIEKLVEYYKTGDLKIFDEYNIAWLKDTDSLIDFTNGFIEVYGDPLGIKASWEAVVNFKDMEANHRAEAISSNAQWFEDNSPVDPQFKKKKVKGVTAKVITAAQLGGDCYPSTPIGINLPNADWIRAEYGSKSVTIENITYSYHQVSQGSGFLEEFCSSQEEIDLTRKFGFIGSNLHTDLHECLGHGSGQLLQGTSPDALKNYASTLEEARADLFALYYIMDKKLIEIGVMPEMDVAKVEYSSYIRGGLITQLTRIEPGKDIEESHMRNRQLIAKWCYEKGKAENVIEMFKQEGKSYCKVNDYSKLRSLFAELLAEVQRIKSEGDFDAGKNLVEKYGVKVDIELNREAKKRFDKLGIAPYGGFVNPVYKPVKKDDKIVDVKIDYVDDYAGQMLYYSEKYSFCDLQNAL